jgi:hypothetical protein
MPWGQFSSLLSHNPALQAIYRLVEAIQRAVLKHSREDALQKRAVDGWEEPVWYQGVQVGTVRRFDGKLLIAALRASDPITYGEKPEVNVTGKQVTISFISVGVDHSGAESAKQAGIIDVSEI